MRLFHTFSLFVDSQTYCVYNLLCSSQLFAEYASTFGQDEGTRERERDRESMFYMCLRYACMSAKGTVDLYNTTRFSVFICITYTCSARILSTYSMRTRYGQMRVRQLAHEPETTHNVISRQKLPFSRSSGIGVIVVVYHI